MMLRSGWGSKEKQERILAIYLRRSFFDGLLKQASPSVNEKQLPKQEWRAIMAASNVRMQWDPDHDLDGGALDRRVIQLGVRHDVLQAFKGAAINRIEDISAFVSEQRELVRQHRLDALMTPEETLYPCNTPPK